MFAFKFSLELAQTLCGRQFHTWSPAILFQDWLGEGRGMDLKECL